MTSKAHQTIPISELEHDASSVFMRLRESDMPAVITESGRATAVILSIEAYERAQAEREILTLLARGEREIAADQGFDLDEVLAEADAVLQQPNE
jgi:prevent-host-death family protein